MKKLWALLLLFILPLPAFSVEPAQFAEWFQLYNEGKELPRTVGTKAASFQYAFVCGFLNEFAPGYFGDNRDTLIASGVPEDAIKIYSPYSSDSIEETVESFLPKRFNKLAQKGKLVLVGHSKGAAEILAFALRNPEFVKENVEAMFLIQGAFGGSGVADYLVGEGHPIDDQWSWYHQFSFEVKSLFGSFLGAFILSDGITSLTHRAAGKYWAQLKKETSPETLAVVSPKIFYIQSVLNDPEKASSFIRASAEYLHTYYGPSDGLVELKDQMVPWVGTPLVVLDSDHTGIVVNNPISVAPKRLREAVTKAIATSL